MSLNRFSALVCLVILMGFPLAYLIRSNLFEWRFATLVDALFAGRECEGEALLTIANALIAINARGEGYAFNLKRAAEIPIRDQPIWVILGSVFPSNWPLLRDEGDLRPTCSTSTLYALAQSSEQADWMAANPDIFAPLAPGSTQPVFLLKLPPLRRILRRGR